jgi:hypothetical protein
MSDELALSQSNSELSTDSFSLIPEEKKYSQNYRVSRIKLSPIDITENMANNVFKRILSGDQAIVLGNHLVMCSSISSIDPIPLKQKPADGHYENDTWVKDKL